MRIYKSRNIFNIAKAIYRTLRENSFQSFIVYGPKGRGKSTYCLKALAHYYHSLGLSFTEAFEEALGHLAFTAYDVLRLIDNDVKIVLWDDAGLWLSTYLWFDERYRRYIESFLDYYDVIRTDAGVIMFTTPSKKKLPPRIREDPSAIIISVAKVGTYKDKEGKVWQKSQATAAENYESLFIDKIIRSTLWHDTFVVKLPDPIYSKYIRVRKKYANYAREKFRDLTIETFKDPKYIADWRDDNDVYKN